MKFLFGILFLLISGAVWIAWGNKALVISPITISCKKLPESFHGYRIAHISDLHNDLFGAHNQTLVEKLKSAQPEMIVITGDLIDSRRTNLSVGLEFAKAAVFIAPTYYVPGNHESRISDYTQFRDALVQLGVTVLEDKQVTITKDSQAISVIGLRDPHFRLSEDDPLFPLEPMERMETVLEQHHDPDVFHLLLSHRPDLIDLYAKHGMDLVLSGHAHGGQIRIPLVGGVIAPNQGYFPKLDKGLYIRGNTRLIVSRGLGNSLFPFRVNNRPEIVLVTLKHC